MWSLKQQTPSEWWLNRGEPTLYKPWLLEKWRQPFSTKRNKEVKCINKYLRHTLYKWEPGDEVWALAHFPNSGNRAQDGKYFIYDSYSVGQDTKASQDTQVGQDTKVIQDTQVGQDTEASQDT